MTSPSLGQTVKGASAQRSLARPTFSIGVTTYDRPEMLKECLASIQRQTFTDFEVIIGDDYQAEPLTLEILGIRDDRFRLVNHPTNLGEMGNMNALLATAGGYYFTWLADDDGYAPVFLESVLAAFEAPRPADCVFTGYVMGATFPRLPETRAVQVEYLGGREFLSRYLRKRLPALGCYGVFRRAYLDRIGGIERIGTGKGPYSDNFLAIKSALMEKVAYIDAPLVLFRSHEGSVSWTSPDVRAYFAAQSDLCRRSLPVLRSEPCGPDLSPNLYALLVWCQADLFHVMRRAGHVDFGTLFRHISLMAGYSKRLGRYCVPMALHTMSGAARVTTRLLGSRMKQRIKRGLRRHALAPNAGQQSSPTTPRP